MKSARLVVSDKTVPNKNSDKERVRCVCISVVSDKNVPGKIKQGKSTVWMH